MKKNKFAMNMFMGLLQQLVTVISGLILPRLILANFGSATNGLLTSITQFLALISLLDMGVGAVVQSALYKPLAEKDEVQVSMVVVSANRFFKRVAYILLVYVIALIFIFPLISSNDFEHIVIIRLIVILAINSFAQYYFSITYRLLLNADQLSYVHLFYGTLATALSTIVSVALILMGASIYCVKLSAAIAFLFQPIMINYYVARHYKINKKIEIIGEPIKQKWNGLAQHFATVILEHTDTAVLTIFSTLESVSVYSVYHMVINGIRQLIISAMSGIKSYLGNIYVTKDIETVNKQFSQIEWAIHSCVVLLFAVMSVLIIPFVRVYTESITDANYLLPVFATIMVAAQGIYCIRLPYNYMVQAAGHFKETQMSAIIEAALNVVISVILVTYFGIVGVAVGTFIAMAYRTIYFAYYLSKNILCRSIDYFVKQIVSDVFEVILIVLATFWIKLYDVSYFSWLVMAIKVFGVAIIVLILFNMFFYRGHMIWVKNYIYKLASARL